MKIFSALFKTLILLVVSIPFCYIAKGQTAAVSERPQYVDISSATADGAVLMTLSSYSTDDVRYRLFNGNYQYNCWDVTTNAYITATSYNAGPIPIGSPSVNSTFWVVYKRGANNSTVATYRDRLGPGYGSSGQQTQLLPVATAISTPFILTGNFTGVAGYDLAEKYVVLGYSGANLICTSSTELTSGDFSLVCPVGETIDKVEIRALNNTSLSFKNGTWAIDKLIGAIPSTTDTDAPILAFIPANGATDIDVSINPTITFNEPVRNIDDSEITDLNVASLVSFKKDNVSGVDVSFTATISADKKVIIIQPSSELDIASTYYLALAPIEDDSDNATTVQEATFTTAAALNNEAAITAYSISGQVESNIDPLLYTVSIAMPNGTSLSSLIASFTLSDGATTAIASVQQVSGTTTNDFTNPVIYTVTAEDNVATQNWTITVTVLSSSSENKFLTFSIPGQTNNAVIANDAKTISLLMPFASDVTALTPKFTLSDYALADVGGAPQASEVSVNDFTSPVTYTVTAQNGATQTWVVTLTVDDLTTSAALPIEYKGPWKNIAENGWKENMLGSDYSIGSDKAAKFEGKNADQYLWLVLHVDSDPDKLNYEVKGNNAGTPIGFDNVNFVIEESVDGSSWATVRAITEAALNTSTYTPFEDQLNNTSRFIRWAYRSTGKGNIALANVKVSKLTSLSNETEISSYSIAGEAIATTVNSTAKTVSVTMPSGTDVTSLIATFSLSIGAEAKVSGITQVSGVTANDFTNPVVYVVTAEDGVATESWTVTVSVQSGSSLSELIISEYIEGSANNKAIELYNGTSSTVDLSDYALKKETNGAGGFTGGLTLSGMLNSGDAYLIVLNTAGTDLKAKADLVSNNAALSFNGNDAVGLFKNNVLIDVVGVVGSPAMWGDNVTLIRKCEITSPNTTYLTTEWDSHATDYFDDAGTHTTCSGGSDTDAPIVTFLPANGATDVAQNVALTVSFNELVRNLDDSEITNTNVADLLTLKQDNAMGVNVGFTAIISANKRTITATPSVLLSTSTTYYFAINPIEDEADNATALHAITFTTEAEIVDSDAPIAIFNPVNGTSGVGINVTPTISFNEPIRNLDDGEINDSNISSLLTLKKENATGTDILFSASISSDKKTITIIPTGDLLYNTIYYLTLDAVEDYFDNSTTLQSILFTTAIEQEFNSEAAIISFTISGQLGATSIDDVNSTINITMPNTASLTSLTPSITLSSGATISPVSGVALNFTIPVTYTVTAENGAERIWTVVVGQRTLYSKADIEAATTDLQLGNTEVNLTTREAKLIVKKGANLGNMHVAIRISEGATISPNPDEVFSYRVPAVYTIVSENGATKRLWTVAAIEVDAPEEGTLRLSFLPGTYTLQLRNDVKGISGVEIFTTGGRRVFMNHGFDGLMAEVDMTRLNGGIYIVKVWDGKRSNVESIKIVR